MITKQVNYLFRPNKFIVNQRGESINIQLKLKLPNYRNVTIYSRLTWNQYVDKTAKIVETSQVTARSLFKKMAHWLNNKVLRRLQRMSISRLS